MKLRQNLILLALVVLMGAVPLLTIRHRAGGFSGSDDQGTDMIGQVSPGYRRWFEPLWVPPSPEVECLLFGLQAALGAGFIGYYLGVSSARAKRKDPS